MSPSETQFEEEDKKLFLLLHRPPRRARTDGRTASSLKVRFLATRVYGILTDRFPNVY